ncbi:MAG: polysaccharide biosynthesis tyrosine autokinase [Hydrococcus sp. SU_1_0]|nr:polysaccharide biosynthesis tyrosine autokinase [Hydrococcus sp. SU_1_0]
MNRVQWELETQKELDGHNDEFGYKQLLAKFWHRRFYFLGVFGSVLAIAVPFALLKQPIYQSYMQILVESNYQGKNLQGNGSNQDLEQEFADAAIEVDYATQLKVLKSSEVLNRVVDKLGYESPGITTAEIVQGLRESLVVSQLANEDSSSKSKTQAETKIIQTVYTATSPTETKRVLEAIQEVYLKYNLEQQEKRLKSGLNFINRQIPQARNDLIKTEATLTELSEEYNLISPEQEAIALKENIRQIAQEREGLQAQQSQTKGNYTNIQDQLGLSPANSLALSRLSQSPSYQNLLNKLQDIEVRLANEQTKFTNDSPIIRELIEQRNRQKALLLKEAKKSLGELPPNFIKQLESLPKQGQLSGVNFIDKITDAQSQITGLQEKDASLAATQAKLKRELANFPALIAQYKNLTQESQIKREALQRLLEAKQRLEIELGRGGYNWQVIESPQIGEKIAPNLLKDLLLSLVVASFLGVTAAFIAESMDDRINDPQELARQSTIPILGVTPELSLAKVFQPRMPFSSTAPPAVVSIKEVIQWQPFREAIDVIYENFKLSCINSSFNSSLKSVAITSAIAEEGKTTFILGLALSVARHQQRVLVIDADLRRPSLHKPFDLHNQNGLANFLAGEIERPIIQQVAFLGETINVISSGSKSQDPVKLLSSNRLQDFIDQQKHNYDLILVDTPPVQGMVDAIKVASICDSSILMMRLDKVKASEVVEVGALLTKFNVLGIVANGSKEVATQHKIPSSYLLPQQV